MPIIPASKDVQDFIRANKKINFSLLYNKYVYISEKNNYNVCNDADKTTEAIKWYKNFYDDYAKEGTAELLKQIHTRQRLFLASMAQWYDILEMKATTKTRFITGIGQSHPSETSIVLDHNLGIPYVPASSIKGLLRFTHVVSLIEGNKLDIEEKKKINDDEIGDISYYYGTQQKCGSAIFLDAYSEKVPDLDIDIMNPHYAKYYQGEKPPADYLDPTPIKFLTVAIGTTFLFRALVPKKPDGEDGVSLIMDIKNIYENALTKEGIGAKTSLGYGFFNVPEITDPALIIGEYKKEVEKIQEAQLNEYERLVKQIHNTQSEDFNKIHEIFNKLKKGEFANSGYESQIAKALMDFYKKAGLWDKPKEKQIARVNFIKQILGIL